MAGSHPYQSEEEMKKGQGGYYGEPAVGIPFAYPPSAPPSSIDGYVYPAQQGQPMMQAPVPQQPGQYTYQHNTNPHQGPPGHSPNQGPPFQQPMQYAYHANTNQHQAQPGQPMMQAPPQQQPAYAYHPTVHPHQAGMVPPNALYGPPNGLPLRETFFADTPAPFECSHCGKSGLTEVKSSPSFAALVGCMVSLVGVCFLCKQCDCLWHKKHYCQNCGQKVANFRKSDPCLVMDPRQWKQLSYAIPA